MKRRSKRSTLIIGSKKSLSIYEGLNTERRKLVTQANEFLREYAKSRQNQRKRAMPKPSCTQT